MFKLSNIPTRYFEMEAPDNHRVLHIEPPKLKTLNELRNWGKSSGGAADAAEIVAKILSKNREGRRVSPETIMEWMNSDQLAGFIRSYMGWLNKSRDDDPN